MPSFLVESPLDTGVARRVKRAYSSLDAVSIRTGVFLRRYPLARILVVLYVVSISKRFKCFNLFYVKESTQYLILLEHDMFKVLLINKRKPQTFGEYF